MNNIFKISGDWEYDTIEHHIKDMDKFYLTNKTKEIEFDFSGLKKIDSSGMIVIIRYINLFKKQNIIPKLSNLSTKHQSMLTLYTTNYTHKDDLPIPSKTNFLKVLEILHIPLLEILKIFYILLEKFWSLFFIHLDIHL